MQTETNTASVSRRMFWAGWIISILPVLMLLMSGIMKFLKPPEVVEGFVHLGWPERLSLGLGIVELVSAAIYLIPNTAVFGAILLTGYLGGATAAHVRIGEQFVIPIVLGVLVWLGLYLRDPRIRALLPLRT